MDKYAKELERALYNWYKGGENADPSPVFNAFNEGRKNDMRLLVPIEQPVFTETMDPETIKSGKTFELAEGIKPKRIYEDDNKYLIPAVTSEEVMIENNVLMSALNICVGDILNHINNLPDCIGLGINPWDKGIRLEKKMIEMVVQKKLKSSICIVRGSVVDMHVGAIVNAANRTLLGGGGVDGAIHRAAGKELREECKKLNGCNTGEAKITGAHGIKHADYIIHTVGPVYSGSEQDVKLLSDCYTNSLDLALENGCHSVAFPCISTGVYGYPIDDAAKISYGTVSKWLLSHPDTFMNVYICCFRDVEFDAYQKILG